MGYQIRGNRGQVQDLHTGADFLGDIHASDWFSLEAGTIENSDKKGT